MEHAFDFPKSMSATRRLSQSTCSWNTRLYEERNYVGELTVAIHVLMEHAFVPYRPNSRLLAIVAIHVLMEHAFVRVLPCTMVIRLVAIHVLIEHAFVRGTLGYE